MFSSRGEINYVIKSLSLSLCRFYKLLSSVYFSLKRLLKSALQGNEYPDGSEPAES